MPTIKSRMIRGVKPNEETLKELQSNLDFLKIQI